MTVTLSPSERPVGGATKAAGSPFRAARLLNPKSIAIIGAPAGEGIGSHLLRNLVAHGFAGEIHLVNPKYDELNGRKCYRTIEAVPGPVDVAAIVVPANVVAETLRACVRSGVGAAVIMAAGFVEDDSVAGKQRQAEIEEAIAGSDLTICGPNSQGFFSILARAPLSFSSGVDLAAIRRNATWMPEDVTDVDQAISGGVAIVAQSGALGFAMFSRGIAAGVGFSHVVSVGNELNLDVLEVAEYLLSLDEVKVVGMYVEGLRRPERIDAVAEAARQAGKVLVIGKAGTSKSGGEAALSHTGHLAGEARVYDAVFQELGVVQVFDEEEMVDVCAAFATQPLPKGDRVGVVSASGGSAVLTADALERVGLTLPPLDEERKASIARQLPAYANARNPLDIAGPGPGRLLLGLVDTPYFDSLVMATTLNSHQSLKLDRADFEKLGKVTGKPILVYSYTEPLPEARRLLRDAGLPLYVSPRRCARALQAMRFVARNRELPARQPLGPAVPLPLRQGGVLTEWQTTELLRAAGFPTTRFALATNEAEAIAAAREIGFPLALKLQAPSVPHKVAAGGVLLNVESEEEVRAGFVRLMNDVAPDSTDKEGVMIQAMVKPGLEMLAGVDNTSGFGPMIMLGFGGSDVESLRDSVMVRAPLTREQALEMIGRLRLGALLTAKMRGVQRTDKLALADFLVRLSDFAVRHRETIRELDINPVVLHEDGVVLVDSLLITQSGAFPKGH